MKTLFKNRLLTLSCIFILLQCPIWSSAQTSRDELKGILTEESNDRWMVFDQPLDMSPQAFFKEYRNQLGLTSEDEMKLIKSRKSTLKGLEIQTYQQYYNGIEVKGATMVAQVKEGKLTVLQGDIARELSLNTRVSISPYEAQINAADHHGGLNAIHFPGEDEEEALSPPKNPKFPIVLVGEGKEVFSQKGLRAAYAVKLSVQKTLSSKIVYVDIENGQIIKSEDNGFHACVTGTVNTMANGAQNFITKTAWEPFWSHHRLKTQCNGYDIVTEDFTKFAWDNPANQAKGTPYKDGNNVWGTPGTPHEGASAHWAVQETWDFYDITYGHEGLDGNGAGVEVFVTSTIATQYRPDHDEIHVQTAAPFTVNVCGMGNTVIPVTSNAVLDILAHEFTHGVIIEGGNLQGGANESGALHEGFSDIFGGMVDRRVGSTIAEIWEFQGNGSPSNLFSRSMQTPNAFHLRPNGACWGVGIPDEFMEPGFWSAAGQQHTNSGPISHWFYLLVTGDTHQNGTTVTGIGFDDAARIAFETMMALPANGNYADARNLAINFAVTIFGFCSPQHIGTIEAFNAINVNPGPLPNQNINSTINGATFTLCTNATATYTVNALAGATYNWTANAGIQILSQNGNSCTIKKTNANNSTLSCTITTTCDMETGNRTISGTNQSLPTTPWLISENYTLCPNQFYQVDVGNPQPGTNYTWSISPSGSGMIIPAGTSATISPFYMSGYFYVYATPSNGCGTGTAGSVQFYVDPNNWSCGNSPFREGVGASMRLFPNPATDKFVLTYSHASRMDLIDINGKVIMTKELNPNETQERIPIQDLAKGMYLVRLYGENSAILGTEKLLKQ